MAVKLFSSRVAFGRQQQQQQQPSPPPTTITRPEPARLSPFPQRTSGLEGGPVPTSSRAPGNPRPLSKSAHPIQPFVNSLTMTPVLQKPSGRGDQGHRHVGPHGWAVPLPSRGCGYTRGGLGGVSAGWVWSSVVVVVRGGGGGCLAAAVGLFPAVFGRGVGVPPWLIFLST
ncbi:hypothetical protein MRS44_014347 [Fusarium solani]|uniref:uncharacterized protein n=1 Tax=Fusarium solani TaxID=169388 RepID=UPI0032C3EE09|nr:hypothetical protein MRS44_014347 [Fusarium solani]